MGSEASAKNPIVVLDMVVNTLTSSLERLENARSSVH